MAIVLYWNGVRIGDQVLWYRSESAPTVAPVVQTGLFQSHAAIAADSPNRLYTLRAMLLLVRSDQAAFDAALNGIQSRVQTTGVVSIVDAGFARFVSPADWLFMEAAAGDPPQGFGGRFTDQLAVQFAGSSIPARY